MGALRRARSLTCTGLLFWGCANPNIYATPRSLPKGAATFTIAPEVYGFGGKLRGVSESARLLPVAPTAGFRYGLLDEVDVSVRWAYLTNTSGDIKWNFLKSPKFDAAFAPGVQWYLVPDVAETEDGNSFEDDEHVVLVHAPFLLGFNINPEVSIIPSVGVTYGFADTPAPDADELEQSQVLVGPFGRLGVGARFRVARRFAVHPELTVLRGFGDSEGMFVFTGGLGLVFGRLPEY